MSKQSNARRFPGYGGANHNPIRGTAKREEAIERAIAWQSLSVKEQIAALDRRLGVRVGAKKQRERLNSAK